MWYQTWSCVTYRNAVSRRWPEFLRSLCTKTNGRPIPASRSSRGLRRYMIIKRAGAQGRVYLWCRQVTTKPLKGHQPNTSTRELHHEVGWVNCSERPFAPRRWWPAPGCKLRKMLTQRTLKSPPSRPPAFWPRRRVRWRDSQRRQTKWVKNSRRRNTGLL